MKIVKEKITTSDASFTAYRYENDKFISPYHFHPEHEIVLVTQSEGNVIVGMTQVSYQPGDLFIFKSNMPHAFFTNEGCDKATSTVIQFTDDCFGKDFFSCPELRVIQNLLYKSTFGMKICKIKHPILELVNDVVERNGVDKLISFIQLLNAISQVQDACSISPQNTDNTTINNGHRINAVLDWIDNNYMQNITLEDVAQIICMSREAFCRCFKKSTGKTFIYYLTQVRINRAVEMLASSDESVITIALNVGFNNISNFNRAFKAFKKTTPTSWRKSMGKYFYSDV